MKPQIGQRWHWTYTGSSINADLIVEITEARVSIFGKCMQVLSSTDKYDVPGYVQPLMMSMSAFNDDASQTIVNDGCSRLEYLPGQDKPL